MFQHSGYELNITDLDFISGCLGEYQTSLGLGPPDADEVFKWTVSQIARLSRYTSTQGSRLIWDAGAELMADLVFRYPDVSTLSIFQAVESICAALCVVLRIVYDHRVVCMVVRNDLPYSAEYD